MTKSPEKSDNVAESAIESKDEIKPSTSSSVAVTDSEAAGASEKPNDVSTLNKIASVEWKIK